MMLELQAAVYSKLDTATVYSIYDDVPQGTNMPYITIGDDQAADYSTDGESGTQASIVVHTWSTYSGKLELKTMQDAVYNALHRANLIVTGYNVLGVDFEYADSMVESDGITRHGVQRFRINMMRV